MTTIEHERPRPQAATITVRVLVVLDGRIGLGRTTADFGLGRVLESITPFGLADVAWTIVRRDATDARVAGEKDAAAAARNPALAVSAYSYRFTAAHLAGFDEVWLFGDNPTDDHQDDDSLVDDAMFSPLSIAESQVLHRWMNAGGGVLAMGDHSTLGASLCSKVPRVRQMRAWLVAQGAPPSGGGGSPAVDRLDTRNPATFEEDDAVPQVISARNFSTGGCLSLPHPVMRFGLLGIQYMPDHMHEGRVIDDADVDVSQKVGLNGTMVYEFPLAVPMNKGKLPAIGGLGTTIALPRPRPRIVADATAQNLGTTFGIVGVYDGGDAGVGRIVVDSTWHHWLSYNTAVIADTMPPVWLMVLVYYQNCLLWLLPGHRRAALGLPPSF